MPVFRAVVSVLLRALGDVSLHPQGRPCGRPPAASAGSSTTTAGEPASPRPGCNAVYDDRHGRGHREPIGLLGPAPRPSSPLDHRRIWSPESYEVRGMRARAALSALPIVGIGVSVYLQVIRPWQLRWGATDDEVHRAMPGDEIVARPSFNATRAVTVRRHRPGSGPGSYRSASARPAGTATTCSTTSGGPAPRASSPSSSTFRPGTSSRSTGGSALPRGSG